MAHTITAVVGDFHCGSTTALSTPKFEIHTGRKKETQLVEANIAQKWLYDNWLDFWEYIKVLAGVRGKYRKHRIVTVSLGEATDGNHHGTVQIVQEEDDQIDIACNVLQIPANLSDGGMFGVIGSEPHSGVGGTNDIRVAERLGFKEIDYELILSIDGVLMDFTHQGRAGQREWTSAAAAQGAEIARDYQKLGMEPPRYAFRGHNHLIDDSGEKLEGIRVVCTPSWQLRTAFGYKIAGNKKRSDIGGMIVNGDALDFSHARYKAAPGQAKVIQV